MWFVRVGSSLYSDDDYGIQALSDQPLLYLDRRNTKGLGPLRAAYGSSILPRQDSQRGGANAISRVPEALAAGAATPVLKAAQIEQTWVKIHSFCETKSTLTYI